MTEKTKKLENVVCFRTNNVERDQIRKLVKFLDTETRSEAIKKIIMEKIRELNL